MRANAIVFFMFTTIVSGIAFLYGGIFTAEVMAGSLALFPIYAVGMFIGSRLFGRASESDLPRHRLRDDPLRGGHFNAGVRVRGQLLACSTDAAESCPSVASSTS